MTVVFVTFIAMMVFILLMSVGVLLGRKPIQGSCGGLSNINGMEKCELCGGSAQKCEELSSELKGTLPRAVDAMRKKQ